MADEIEDKFDVPTDFTMPDLRGLPGCATVTQPTTYHLVAIYLDTADLRLAAMGVTLRRRRGGTDAGWHLKLPKAKGVRQEITHRLTPSARIVPAELAELVTAYVRGRPLGPVAQLEAVRTVTSLLNEAGDVLVEVADDRVRGTDLRDTDLRDSAAQTWREVEAELGPAGTRALLGHLGDRLSGAGAEPAASASKLGRLLGEPASRAEQTPEGTAGAVVADYLATQVKALLAQDPRVRRAEDDAVHQMRVACRRLRSALRSFGPVIDRNQTAGIADELRWLGGELSEARDLEVSRARFTASLGNLAPELVRGRVRERLVDDLLAREDAAYEQIRATLNGDRYLVLLDALDDLVARPPFRAKAGKDAPTVLEGVARKGWARVESRYAIAQEAGTAEAREQAMHDVRKAAKRARYTAEAVTPVLGGRAKELAKRAEAVQEALGLYQDGVVAQEFLRDEAAKGGDPFTFRLLIDREHEAEERARAEFGDIWRQSVEAIERQGMR